jgi:hypothetical protein
MNRHQDSAFNHLLNNMLEGAVHSSSLSDDEPVNDRHEHLLALQRRFATSPATGFHPGQIVQWKPGMRNRRIPVDGEPAIVMEVLNPPVFDMRPEMEGSNLFREPLTLVLGLSDKNGDFLTFHYDGRRFEVCTDAGETP